MEMVLEMTQTSRECKTITVTIFYVSKKKTEY